MLVRLGLKQYETRSWKTGFRGRLLIHASKTNDYVTMLSRGYFAEHIKRAKELRPGYANLHPAIHPGHVVATAILADCRPTAIVAREVDEHERAFGDYTPGRFAWHLTEVRPLPHPIKCRGMQGLWLPSPELVQQVEAQIARAS